MVHIKILNPLYIST